MNKNIYFIHLEQDIGKYEYINNFRDKLGGQFWSGEYIIPCDDNGFKLKNITKGEATYAAKKAKIKLFKHFLNNSTDDYLVVFEDDIIWHKKFTKYWSKVKKIINRNKDWKLLYLGVSSPLDNSIFEECQDEFQIINLPMDKIYTGAYGFIIKRDIIREIIKLAENNLTKYNPFDYTCLGAIQKKYGNDCFITVPQLVIVDVTDSNIRNRRKQDVFIENMGWDVDEYIICNKIPLFVVINNNIRKLKRFMFEISILSPIIKIFLIQPYKLNSQISSLLNEYREQGINTYFLGSNDFDNKLEIFLNKMIDKNKLCFITNITISWRHEFPKHFFRIIENIFKRSKEINMIEFQISQCLRCTTKQKKIEDLKYYQGFSVIKSSLFKKGINNATKISLNSMFYSNNCCYEVSDNDYHNLDMYDIIQDLNDYNDNIICRSCISLLDIDELGWIHIFEKWLPFYFYNKIKTVCNLDLELGVDEVDVLQKNIKNFNTSSFRLLKFGCSKLKNKMVIYLNSTILTNIFGSVNYNKLNELCEKYNIMIKDIEFNINFV